MSFPRTRESSLYLPHRARIPSFAGMRTLSCILFSLIGCAKHPALPHIPDSARTSNAVQEMQGKKMRTFHGPSEILGDTTKNARHPPMVKSEPFDKLRAGT